jgi:hypothetical protein
LSRWAEDHRLREVTASFAREEGLTLERFRSVYERSARTDGMRWFAGWFAARRLVRLARDVQLPFVFACLAAHWRPHAPIAEMSYRDFVRRMRGVVRQRGDPGFAARALFAPWGRRPRLRVTQRAGYATSGFKPATVASF